MRLGNYFRVLSVLTVSLFWHSTASAEDYYWPAMGINHQSASAACSYIMKTSYPTVSGPGYKMSPDGKIAYCTGTLVSGGQTYYPTYSQVTRAGTSCPSGTEYDPSTGDCVAPDNPCADLAGTYDRFSKAGIAPDSFVSIANNGYAIPQRQGCKNGCAAQMTDIRGKTRVSGEYLYTGSMMYTGDQCTVTGSGDELGPDEGQNVEPQVIKEDTPCVYSASGDKQVCQSGKSEEQEGRSCGTVNGVETCVSTVPSKNGIDIRTEVTEQILEDGSTVTTKKDIATVTACKGINNCTTSTATTTTTTRTDANGNKIGESSNCIGSACGSSSNPDADGDGVGDCKPGEDCSQEGSGEGQDWYTPTGDTFGSVLTEFVGKVQQTPVASQTSSFLTFRATGSCPRWSVSVWVFDIDIDQLCNGDIPWNAIKAVILAAAGFFAFRIALL